MTRRQICSLGTLTAVVCVACAALLIAGCGSGSGGSGGGAGSSAGATQSSGPAATAPNTIVVKNFMFAPMTLTVSPGATVTVKNEDTATHTVTASDKSFDSGDVSPGGTKTFQAPEKAGSYGYICTVHNYMQGTLTVK